MDYNFRVPLTVEGQRLHVLVDTAGSRLRLRPELSYLGVSTCKGDECYVCATWETPCLGADTYTAWTDARHVVYSTHYRYGAVNLTSEKTLTLPYGIMNDKYNDDHFGVGYMNIYASALGLGGGPNWETFSHSLFPFLAEQKFSIIPATSGVSAPGALILGKAVDTPHGFDSGASINVYLHHSKYKDFRAWQYKALVRTFSAPPDRDVLSNLVMGFDSTAPIIYLTEHNLRRLRDVTNKWLNVIGSKLREFDVPYAVHGYLFDCPSRLDLPKFELDVYKDEYKTFKGLARVTLAPRDYTRVYYRPSGVCQWLFGTSKTHQLRDDHYMIMGQPFFRNHFTTWQVLYSPDSFKDSYLLYFASRRERLAETFGTYGSFKLAVDYSGTTVLSIDDQSVQVLVDTSLHQMMIIDARSLSPHWCSNGNCYNCSEVECQGFKCNHGTAKYHHITPDSYIREIVEAKGIIQLSSWRETFTFALVTRVSRRPYFESALGVGRPRGWHILNQLVEMGSEVDSSKVIALYLHKSPVSKLGELSLGSTIAPFSEMKLKVVAMTDAPADWRDAKDWPMVIGERGYVTTSTTSASFAQKGYIEFIAFLSGYDLIYGPEEAIADLIAKLDPLRKLITGMEVDDAITGWNIRCDDVKNLPTVNFDMAHLFSTVTISLYPEDYTAYSTTQCDVCRILFGAMNATEVYPKNTNYWILGKPYFRTHYTEFHHIDQGIYFTRLPDTVS
ncbi:hypothetical protein FOL47_009486 [Perkinsus chesapeaki]|uniref:Peptidase A1 domain-containing protein n=1 Tax=Perkinsus chesapeaki TaxID=330153 RepID=A0A7J6L7Z1_PERCH|nr:hypothetical protein FOL47_009486 [Perkinsus chesapeaki]